ncbi:MAG: cyclic nucleotide-binding domain-containing protein [Alphaproteobacteria bacterium]|nr:cyclic nucleotide-binding domain-containing protein [Alphaproteobacteria bacterium]
MEKRSIKKGEKVFVEGDQGDAAFVVEVGSIAIAKSVEGRDVRLATVGSGELFGEMAILDGSPRMASATALEDSLLLVVPRGVLDAKFKKSDPFLQTLVRILVSNLRSVHDIYMKRPRSSQDFLSAMSFHATSLAVYLEKLEKPELMDAAGPSLAAVQSALLELKRVLAGHQDRRASVLNEAELVVPVASRKLGDAEGSP